MTPAVRRIIKENNIDLAHITPTGKNSRVLKEDVIRFIDGGSVPPPAPAQAAPQASSHTLLVFGAVAGAGVVKPCRHGAERGGAGATPPHAPLPSKAGG